MPYYHLCQAILPDMRCFHLNNIIKHSSVHCTYHVIRSHTMLSCQVGTGTMLIRQAPCYQVTHNVFRSSSMLSGHVPCYQVYHVIRSRTMLSGMTILSHDHTKMGASLEKESLAGREKTKH